MPCAATHQRSALAQPLGVTRDEHAASSILNSAETKVLYRYGSFASMALPTRSLDARKLGVRESQINLIGKIQSRSTPMLEIWQLTTSLGAMARPAIRHLLPTQWLWRAHGCPCQLNGSIQSPKRGVCGQTSCSYADLRQPTRSSPALKPYRASLDRAALWGSSVHADLAAQSAGLVDRTCVALLPTIPRQMRSLTCLGRMSLDHLPTAMAAARAAFEAGLRLAWIDAAHDQREREIRVLCLHNDQARWKSAVASAYDCSGEEGRSLASCGAGAIGASLSRTRQDGLFGTVATSCTGYGAAPRTGTRPPLFRLPACI